MITRSEFWVTTLVVRARSLGERKGASHRIASELENGRRAGAKLGYWTTASARPSLRSSPRTIGGHLLFAGWGVAVGGG